MGGTSFDVALIAKGRSMLSPQTSIDFGMLVRSPMIEITTIGGGGGSIAWVDKGGLPNIEPESAGSNPGPVAYGLGNDRPTVTDAKIVLGRIDPDNPIGGKLARLDVEAAAKAIDVHVGQPLDLGTLQAAEAILKVANSRMAGAIRLVSIERGFDPKRFAFMPFGGGGALHAGAMLAETSIARAIVPRYPGVTSAIGCVVANMRQDFVQTINTLVDTLDEAIWSGSYKRTTIRVWRCKTVRGPNLRHVMLALNLIWPISVKPTGSGADLINALREVCEVQGIDIICERRAAALFCDGRTINGVSVTRPDGVVETIGCARLTLACNGFGGNRALVCQHMPDIKDAVWFGHDGNRGQAVLWAGEIGARALGLPADTLEHTARQIPCGGTDAFGRTFGAKPLAAPFYGVRVTGALFHTQGGLVVNDQAQVLRVDGSAFSNLYAGGGAACGVSGKGDSGYLFGNGLLSAFALGRRRSCRSRTLVGTNKLSEQR